MSKDFFSSLKKLLRDYDAAIWPDTDDRIKIKVGQLIFGIDAGYDHESENPARQ